MRKRSIRELGTIFVIVIILGAVVVFNGYMRRGTLTEYFEKARRAAEAAQAGMGVPLLEWKLLRETTGTMKSGPKFDEGLLAIRDGEVNIIGFMVPLQEFRQVKEFLLLPLPVQCYFCEAPPMRDVMLVQMAEGEKTDIVNEPVIVSGLLTLNEGAGTKFFYVLKEASREAAEKGGKLTKKNLRPEAIDHMKNQNAAPPQLMPGFEMPPAGAQTPAAPAQ